MNKMEKGNKGLYAVIIVLGLAVITLSIAFAALSTTLNINFKAVTQTAQTWNVGFEAKTVTATASGTSTVGRSCGTATVSASSATIADTSLSKPGDKCTYELTIKNSGTIDANLATITSISPSGSDVSCDTSSAGKMVCGNITYKLTTDSAGTTLLTTNKSLSKNGTLKVYLIAEYTGENVANSEIEQTGAGFTLIYNQA